MFSFLQTLIWGVLAFLLLFAEVPAIAAPPDYYDVHYTYREANDETGPRKVKLTLDLKNMDTNATQIEWKCDEIRITAFSSNGEVWATWKDETCAFDTTNGRWWVTHADKEAPDADEFLSPPDFAGTADYVSGTEDTFYYEITTGSCSGCLDDENEWNWCEIAGVHCYVLTPAAAAIQTWINLHEEDEPIEVSVEQECPS